MRLVNGPGVEIHTHLQWWKPERPSRGIVVASREPSETYDEGKRRTDKPGPPVVGRDVSGGSYDCEVSRISMSASNSARQS